MSFTRINAAEFANRYQQDLLLIDVRSPAEFNASHIQGATNAPLDRFNPADVARTINAEQAVYLICQAGGRAAKAAEQLRQHTRNTIYVIEGGTPQSIAAGCPANTSNKNVISLERQVRIAAGGLVAMGTALGWAVHPGFYGIAAFVGCGLLFAGITDTCAMGMLLARMPWNKA